MRLARFQEGQFPKIGFLFEEQILELLPALEYGYNKASLFNTAQLCDVKGYTDIIEYLRVGGTLWDDLQKVYALIKDSIFHSTKEAGGVPLIPIEQVRMLPPVGRPGKVICVGMNYPLIESDIEVNIPRYPILFHKVSSSLTGHKNPIILPRISQEVNYEGELAIMISKPGKNIERHQASSYIAGYSIANDIGAGDIEARSSQWASGKMFDTFLPLGPALVTHADAPDPNHLCIRTMLNDRCVQDSSTSEMIFDIPFLISYISSLTSLEPGDIILTGSPKRVGDKQDPRLPLQPGDIIQVQIENIGRLINPVVAGET